MHLFSRKVRVRSRGGACTTRPYTCSGTYTKAGGRRPSFTLFHRRRGCRACPRNALNLESICQRYLSADCECNHEQACRVSWFAWISRERYRPAAKKCDTDKWNHVERWLSNLAGRRSPGCLKLIYAFGCHKLFGRRLRSHEKNTSSVIPRVPRGTGIVFKRFHFIICFIQIEKFWMIQTIINNRIKIYFSILTWFWIFFEHWYVNESIFIAVRVLNNRGRDARYRVITTSLSNCIIVGLSNKYRNVDFYRAYANGDGRYSILCH